MSTIIETFSAWLTQDMTQSALRAAAILSIGLLLASVLPRRIKLGAVPAQRIFVLRTIVRYALIVMTFVWVLRELGFELSVLLGAAGIFTVAIGFASQTSASNLISGLFLLGEQPFGVGDIIRVADVLGEVMSIDALSVKIRTFDNLLVRVPNETMLKSNVTNLTKFPVRRVDLQIGVAYKEDLGAVEQVLLEVADKNPICLEEPKPRLFVQGFADSSISLQLSVWTVSASFVDLRNAMYRDIKARFDELDIEIPFPHRTLYTGAATKPLPVQLVRD